ncbi:hypothetical protein KW797_00215 [Candidatus Parcubacteria bacterium]|nr:hypothetical protein [Candidatus Parcubacteria bacterium]
MILCSRRVLLLFHEGIPELYLYYDILRDPLFYIILLLVSSLLHLSFRFGAYHERNRWNSWCRHLLVRTRNPAIPKKVLPPRG